MNTHPLIQTHTQECPGGPTEGSAASASLLAGPTTSFVELTTRVEATAPSALPPYDPALAAATDAAKDRISRFY